MHKLLIVAEDIEKTHSRLGNAVAFAAICVKAKKCLLVVSPAGCGKSSISDAILEHHPQALKLDSVTRNGLRDFREQFNGFQGLIDIDDLGKVDNDYSRISTVTSFAELCYSHFISKHSAMVSLEISEFHGSTIINVQPPMLDTLIRASEWEVVIQDKTIRYYHFYRPLKPCQTKPQFKIDWGIDFNTVHKPDHKYKLYSRLEEIGSIQWSDSRNVMHIDDLLKASAALDGRQDVNGDDFTLLAKLMKPMIVEKYCKEKLAFESARSFNTNLLAVLVEFASWKNINISRICRDYKVTEATVYRLLSDIKDWFEPNEPMSKRLVPTKELVKVLKDIGAR